MKTTVAVHPDRLKDAALYFDECITVFPYLDLDNHDVAAMSAIINGRFEPKGEAGLHRAMQSWAIERKGRVLNLDRVLRFMPPALHDDYKGVLEAQFFAATAVVTKHSVSPEQLLAEDPYTWQISEDLAQALLRNLLLNRHAYLSPTHVTGIPEAKADPETAMLTIANARMVNTSLISWEQIDELRKDRAALTKLRNLRLLALDSYVNKDPEYVRDSLERSIEQYEAEAKKQGLSLADAAYSIVSESPSFIALAMILFGTPTAAAVKELAVAGTAAISLGKIAFTLSKALRERRSALALHPVAYLMTLEQLATEQ